MKPGLWDPAGEFGRMRSMPGQVWRLMFAYALMMSGSSLMVLIAGIIGVYFAPSPGLATLPIALTIVGLALSTLPTGKLLNRFGRRRVFISYGFVAVGAALLSAWSLSIGNFMLFCLAAMFIGWSAAAGHQYRFAAMESVPAELSTKATSLILLGGILAAFVGPEIAVRGQHLFKTDFTGSYVLLAVLSSGWFLYQWGWHGAIYACVPLLLVFVLLIWRNRVALVPAAAS